MCNLAAVTSRSKCDTDVLCTETSAANEGLIEGLGVDMCLEHNCDVAAVVIKGVN